MRIDSSSPSGLFTHLGLIRVSGPDALSFLQGQISNDTRLLAQNGSLLAAYSSPQGRVLAIIYLFPHSSGTLAVLPAELIAGTLERLRRFVLRAKVQLEDVSQNFAVAGSFAAALEPGYTEQHSVGLSGVGHDAARTWIVGPREALLAAGASADPAFERAWRLADIRAGLPQVYAANSEVFVAQMLNLDRLDGISFTKGCYTGQEIIARTQHLGRIKRRMVHLAMPPGEWQIGQTIRLPDGRHGRLAEVVADGTRTEALAVLTLEGAGEPDAPSAAVEAREMPLPYAFA